jgi:hypothetical protein
MSSNIFPTTGAIKITDMRILNNNVVHLSGNETISGQKTFNDTLISTGITNTGTITSTSDISTLGKLTSNNITTGVITSTGITNTGTITSTSDISTLGKLTIGGNVINSSSTVNINGSINILSGKYISFGSDFESNSYGLRDNNGKIEYKNSSGSWNEISYIADNTLTLAKINNQGGTGLNVILDNNTFGKVSNNVIDDNTISGSKLADSSVSITKLSGGGAITTSGITNNGNMTNTGSLTTSGLLTANGGIFTNSLSLSGSLATSGITNTGNITTGSLLASNGKKYLRLINISN